MDMGAGKMAFPQQHERHKKRFSRNLGVGLTLVAFVVLTFALTIVKVSQGDTMHQNDGKPAPQAEVGS